MRTQKCLLLLYALMGALLLATVYGTLLLFERGK